MERYLRVNLLGPGPRLMKKVFTGPRSQVEKHCSTHSNVICHTGFLTACDQDQDGTAVPS